MAALWRRTVSFLSGDCCQQLRVSTVAHVLLADTATDPIGAVVVLGVPSSFPRYCATVSSVHRTVIVKGRRRAADSGVVRHLDEP